MSKLWGSPLPLDACGLRLAKIVGDDLRLCEIVMFSRGYEAVQTVLLRAAIAGRVEVNGKIDDHFADVIDADHSMIETIALDAKSFKALKNHWMRCKYEAQA